MKLEAENIEVRYREHIAVAVPELALDTGEFVALVGPNGAGKTSLLRALAGLRLSSGVVSWQGQAVASMTARERARTIAYLPQTPRTGWPLKVKEIVELGRLPHRRFGQRPTAADTARIERALEMTDTAGLADRPIDALSGGERMRVQLARAFAVDAPVLLVDEPVASLDPYHQLKVIELLAEYAAASRLVVAVLHDLTLAARRCTRMVLLDAGAIAADGPPANVLNDEALARHYRISAYIAEHENRRLAVPWEMLG
ncbi:MAG: ABC transporter ATP-binding protein [Gammaproteobacteria bacterium]|nr:ABC transporter ATP-binding protein [Gammaproteobacteria bacterium]